MISIHSLNYDWVFLSFMIHDKSWSLQVNDWVFLSFMIHLYHLSWFQWGIVTSMGWSRDFFWWQKSRSHQVGVWKSTRIARRYFMTKFINFPMIFPWFSHDVPIFFPMIFPIQTWKITWKSRCFGRKTMCFLRAARCTTRCSGFWWFAHGSQFRDQVVMSRSKEGV